MAAFSQISSPDFDIQKLAPGVFAAIHKPGGRAICNAGIVDLGKETLVFDPFISPYAAGELKRVIKEMGLSPVKYVVNSHYHNDHIRGNQAFDSAAIYSTQITWDLIEKNEPEEIAHEKRVLPERIHKSDSILASIPVNDIQKRKEAGFWNNYYKTILESHQDLKTKLPDHIVIKNENIKGTRLEVQLIDMGEGHTMSDLILYIPKYNIVFTGDLLFIQNHPWLADGSPDSLKHCLLEIKAMNPAILVPGHGPVGAPKDVDTFLHYLDDINLIALDLIAKWTKPGQVAELPIPPAYQDWLMARFYTPNIKFRMEQLLSRRK
jgi:glyoxylase-like metal-dependent hydrolase (beta-lactamase superfamily II)